MEYGRPNVDSQRMEFSEWIGIRLAPCLCTSLPGYPRENDSKEPNLGTGHIPPGVVNQACSDVIINQPSFLSRSRSLWPPGNNSRTSTRFPCLVVGLKRALIGSLPHADEPWGPSAREGSSAALPIPDVWDFGVLWTCHLLGLI